MKKLYTFMLCLTVILLLLFYNSSGQSISVVNKKPSKWNTNNPFRSNVFIKNEGQFNNSVESAAPVKYAINSWDKIFFTSKGLTFKLETIELMSEEERDKFEDGTKEEAQGEDDTYFVKMNWIGSNVNSVLEAEQESEGYYTFGEKGYENVKAKGYKRLLYKELYPGIDVEYTIPDKGGIKYKIILHPGADISKVKMQYSGNIENIIKDDAGNIEIKTPAGSIIDHAPQSFFQENNSNIASEFNLKDNFVSIKLKILPSPNSQISTIIIDPWTITPSSLTNSNIAYDIDFDNGGNVYVSGGSSPFKIAKYSNTGAFLWVYSLSNSWSRSGVFGSTHMYSKFCVIHSTGTLFLGEGINSSGPRALKLNSAGQLVTMSTNFSGNSELWVMFYNECTGQIKGFGGGTNNSNNLQIVADTNLTSSTIGNFNGSYQSRNDIAAVVQDYNGDFYAFVTSLAGQNDFNDHIQKSLSANNYIPPCAFDVMSNYNFNEHTNSGIPGFTPNNVSVRANILALNSNYLFSYDGQIIRAWDKNNGTLLSEVIVDYSYLGGQARTHEGIATDECNNVYVGGTGIVHVYNFDGTTFYPITPITTNIPNEVYDISLDLSTNFLYVSGNGFVTVTQGIVCETQQLSLITSIDNCNGTAVINVLSGVPPYKYHWSNGNTTNSITAPPGIYTVTVTDNSCNLRKHIDTVPINPPFKIKFEGNNVICKGVPTTITATGGTSYKWSHPESLNNPLISNPTANPSVTTTYTVTATGGDPGCPQDVKDSIIVYVVPYPHVKIITDKFVICKGETLNLQAQGANTYNWSPSAIYVNPDGSNVNIKPSVTTTYTIRGNNIFLGRICHSDTSMIIKVNALPDIKLLNDTVCLGNSANISVSASGGTPYSPPHTPYSYKWQTGDTITSINVLTNVTTNYTVTVTDANSCKANGTVTVLVNPKPKINLGPDIKICIGKDVTLTATITSGSAPFFYKWSTDETSDNITVKPNSTQTYKITVTDSKNCFDTSHVKINIITKPSITISPSYPKICKGDSVKVNLTGSANVYKWSPDIYLSSASGDVVFAYPPNTMTYTINASDNAGCAGDTSIVITVSDINILASMSKNKLCFGDTVHLKALANNGIYPYIYNWSPGNISSSEIIVHGNNHTDTVQLTTFKIEVIDNNNCKLDSNISLYLLPDINTSSVTDTICYAAQNGIINLKVFDSDGKEDANGSSCKYIWSNNAKTKDIKNLLPGNYIVTITDKNNCLDTFNAKVVSHPKKIIDISPVNSKICKGGYTTIYFPTIDNYVLTPRTGIADTSTGRTITAFPTVTTKYNFKTKDKYGCNSDTTLIVIVSNIKTSIYKYKDKVCFGDTLKIRALSKNGIKPYTYLWNPGNETSSVKIFNNNTDSLTLRVENITLSVKDSINCKHDTSFSFTFLPSVKIDIKSDSVCPSACDGKIILKVTDSEGNTDNNGNLCQYTWNNSANSKDLNLLCTGSYSVIIKDKNNCTKTSNTILIPTVIIDTSYSANPVQGNSPLIVVFKYTGNDKDFKWNLGDYKSNNNIVNDKEVSHIYKYDPDNFKDNKTSYVALLIISNSKCTDTLKIPIDVKMTGRLDTVSNIVTVNNKFGAIGMGLKSFNLLIFNRWGNKIFENTNLVPDPNDKIIKDYQEIYLLWDGKKNNGVKVEAGTYFYILTATTVEDKILPERKGNITVLK